MLSPRAPQAYRARMLSVEGNGDEMVIPGFEALTIDLAALWRIQGTGS